MGNVMRGLKVAVLGAAAVMGGVMASDDDLASMKATLESMKAEMAAVKADYAASQARSQAGGVPGGLTSANGNATIRIGGVFHTTYGIGFSSPFEKNHSGNSSSTYAGWGLTKAELDFRIDLSADTTGVIVLRPDGGGSLGIGSDKSVKIIDEAYYQWRNIGGSPLQLEVGLRTVPIGMSGNGDVGGYAWDKVMIDDAVFVKSAYIGSDYAYITKSSNANKALDADFKAIGIFGKYALIEDQLFLKAGLFSQGITGSIGGNNNSPWTDKNEIRNIGFIDHVVTLAYNPCNIEGLHLEASYVGRFDSGYGSDFSPINGAPGEIKKNAPGYSSYAPTFDVGVGYKFNDKFALGAEFILGAMQKWQDQYGYAISLYGDYSVTDKFSLAAGADMYHGYQDVGHQARAENLILGKPAHDAFLNVYRLTIGAKYAFNNGIYVKAQYFHDWADVARVTGISNDTHNTDALLLQTGYTF